MRILKSLLLAASLLSLSLAQSAQAKTLVVYYSESGYTEAVAKTIASHLNGELFRLIPQRPYSSADLDYNNPQSRVCREHDDPNREVRLRESKVQDFASYDTVFIAYPIWWGIAAFPVDDFIKHNDFSHKKVIPVATSYSSPLGQSGELLARLAGTGEWQKGIRFASGVGDLEVTDWVDSLGLK